MLSVRLIAAQAAKLADDLEHGRLWDGDYEAAMAKLQAELNAAKLA